LTTGSSRSTRHEGINLQTRRIDPDVNGDGASVAAVGAFAAVAAITTQPGVSAVASVPAISWPSLLTTAVGAIAAVAALATLTAFTSFASRAAVASALTSGIQIVVTLRVPDIYDDVLSIGAVVTVPAVSSGRTVRGVVASETVPTMAVPPAQSGGAV